MTGARRLEPPVRRDDDRPALRRRRRGAVARADAEPAAGRRRATCARRRPRRWPRPSGKNLRIFTLITNTLAKDKEISDRWRGFEDIADSRHLANRVEREVVDALAAAVREAYPRLSHRYYAMKAHWLGMDQLNHWDRNAPLPETPQATIGWDEAQRHRAVGLSAASRRRWPRSPGASSTSAGSTRRCGPARRRAPSPIRPCRRRTPMCCSTTWASRAT